jgi:hypothetical protein
MIWIFSDKKISQFQKDCKIYVNNRDVNCLYEDISVWMDNFLRINNQLGVFRFKLNTPYFSIIYKNDDFCQYIK